MNIFRDGTVEEDYSMNDDKISEKDCDSKIAQDNYLAKLTQSELVLLLQYLFSLNEGVNWGAIVNKHQSSTNKAFIKHVKSLTWTDKSETINYMPPLYTLVRSCVSNCLMQFNVHAYPEIKLLGSSADSNKFSRSLISIIDDLTNTYHCILSMSHPSVEIIENMSNMPASSLVIVTGGLTHPGLEYQSNMIIDPTLPTKMVSPTFNKLMMLIIENTADGMDSDENYVDYPYNFIEISQNSD